MVPLFYSRLTKTTPTQGIRGCTLLKNNAKLTYFAGRRHRSFLKPAPVFKLSLSFQSLFISCQAASFLFKAVLC